MLMIVRPVQTAHPPYCPCRHRPMTSSRRSPKLSRPDRAFPSPPAVPAPSACPLHRRRPSARPRRAVPPVRPHHEPLVPPGRRREACPGESRSRPSTAPAPSHRWRSRSRRFCLRRRCPALCGLRLAAAPRCCVRRAWRSAACGRDRGETADVVDLAVGGDLDEVVAVAPDERLDRIGPVRMRDIHLRARDFLQRLGWQSEARDIAFRIGVELRIDVLAIGVQLVPEAGLRLDRLVHLGAQAGRAIRIPLREFGETLGAVEQPVLPCLRRLTLGRQVEIYRCRQGLLRGRCGRLLRRR